MAIGSFRNKCNYQDLLPDKIRNLLFQHETSYEIGNLHIISEQHDNRTISDLNPAAFGRCYKDCFSLQQELIQFSETNPDVFYDEILLNLLNFSYQTCEEFFKTDKVVLQPNTTLAVKSVVDAIVNSHLDNNTKKLKFAVVNPIYDPTKILLKKYAKLDKIDPNVVEITPNNVFFNENVDEIANQIQDQYQETNFDVLMLDYITSQSGRILDFTKIAEFCQEHNIKLVVDGSHCFDFSTQMTSPPIWKIPDFFVFATHKWLGNCKTCAVTVFKDKNVAPEPVAYSFGYAATLQRDFDNPLDIDVRNLREG